MSQFEHSSEFIPNEQQQPSGTLSGNLPYLTSMASGSPNKSKSQISLTIVANGGVTPTGMPNGLPSGMHSANNSFSNVPSLRNTPLSPTSAINLAQLSIGNEMSSPMNNMSARLPQHMASNSGSHLGSLFQSEGNSPIATVQSLSSSSFHNASASVSSSLKNSFNFNSIANNYSIEKSGGKTSASNSAGNSVSNWFSPNDSPSQRSPASLTSQRSQYFTGAPIPLTTHYETSIPPVQSQFFAPPRAPAPVPTNNYNGSGMGPGAGGPYGVNKGDSHRGHKRGQSMGVIQQRNQQRSTDYYPLPSFAVTLQQYHQNNMQQKQQEYQLQQQQMQIQMQQQQQQQQQQHIEVPRLKPINSKDELTPIVSKGSSFRRAATNSEFVSPLKALTMQITTSYTLSRPEFSYQTSGNPRRILTKSNEPHPTKPHDNKDGDYILYVNDVLGVEESRKYVVLDILGQGTFGQVVKCQNLLNKEILAVKVVKSIPACMNQSLSEISILEIINSKIDPMDKHNFLRIKDRFLHKGHLCIALELLSNNLYELIKQNNYNGLAPRLVKSFSKQLLGSLVVLKTYKIIHCDLKPENILLVHPNKENLKVIDFGSACYERQAMFTYIQSRFYRSPEVILGLPYSCAVDMWSFGCIIAELFLGLPLLPGSSEFDQLSRIIDIFGYPATWMIEMGKNSLKFLEKTPSYPATTSTSDLTSSVSFYEYKLKSVDKYSQEFNVKEKKGTNYFGSKDLNEIVMTYRPNKYNQSEPKNKTKTRLTPQETSERLNLLHFLKGVLNINPLERWTPQQALAHPFINDLPYDENWVPPGSNAANSVNNSNGTNGMFHNGIQYAGNGNNNNSSNNRRRAANMHRRGQLSTSAITNSKLSNGLYFNGNEVFGSSQRNTQNDDSINSFKFPLNN